MTTAMRRTLGMIAVTTVLVAGCSTGQGDPKVAVVVGGENISTVEQVQRKLNDLVATDPAVQEQAKQHKLDLVARGIVGQLALNKLAEQVAKRENISIDEETVNRLAPTVTGQQATQGDPFQAAVDAAFPVNEIARTRLLLAQLGARELGKSTVTVDGVLLNDAQAARQLAKQIAEQPNRSGELVQKAPNPLQEPFVDQPFGGEPANVPPGQEDQALQAFVNQNQLAFIGAPENTVLAWRLTGQQGGWAVIHVKKRTPVSKAPQLDLTSVPTLQYALIGQARLFASALQEGVRPNQRFGVWDPVDMKVVSATEAPGGNLVLPVKTAKP